MTSADFKSWLFAAYGRGQRLAFVGDFNAVAESFGAPLITLGAEGAIPSALNNWLSRSPPALYGGIEFERFLALVLERQSNPTPPARIYSLTVPVDARTNTALEGIAVENGLPVETFLCNTLAAQLEDEVDLWEKRRQKRRARPKKK